MVKDKIVCMVLQQNLKGEKMKKPTNVLKDKHVVAIVVTAIAFALMLIGLVLFTVSSFCIIDMPALWLTLFFGAWAVALVLIAVLRKREVDSKWFKFVSIGLIAVSAIYLLILILFSLVVNFFQPLSLQYLPTVFLITGVVVLLVSSIVGLLVNQKSVANIIAPILTIVLMTTGLVWGNAQGYQEYSNIVGTENYLFENGEGGYSTFRIPSLIALDKDSLNANHGLSLTSDVLIASAEARKNSSHDTGEIDLVYKSSSDNGKTWSDVTVLLKVENEIGKVGNPTPVFDKQNGVLNMIYLTASEKTNYKYSTYNARYILDSELKLVPVDESNQPIEKAKPISLNTEAEENANPDDGSGATNNFIMPGPGKGIQIESGVHSGRLIFPSSRHGHSRATYSDDFGLTWHAGESAGEGNECEISMLDNGELIMVLRDNASMGDLVKRYLRFSYSNDDGETWYSRDIKSELPTPVCMTSIATVDSSVVVTYPHDYYTRGRLTIGVSKDNGKSFEDYAIYDGAAGYSCVTVLSDGRVFVLAEVGKVNYNEALVFVEIDKDSIGL